MKRRLLRTLLLLAVALGAQPALATTRTVIAHGAAALNGQPPAMVRQTALEDAVREASLMGGLRVSSVTTMETDGLVTDNVQVSSVAQVRGVEVLEEWTEGDILHVRARVRLDDGSAACEAPRYRKRIAAFHFPLATPAQQRVDEVSGFETGVPSELLRRLAESGEFLTIDAGARPVHIDPAIMPYTAPPALAPAPSATRTAEQYGAQFLLSGTVRDIGIDARRRHLPLVGDLLRDHRRIEVEFQVHDGATGALLMQHAYARVAKGEVVVNRDVTFGSARFYRSDFGQAVGEVLDESAHAIQEGLRCRPFVARVLRMKGKEVYLDAGAEALMGLGDTLTAYAPDGAELVTTYGETLGREERAAARLTVKRVYPRYAVAELDVDPRSVYLRPGDQVRSW